MIDFHRLDPAQRAEYDKYLSAGGRNCEHSFVNLCIWGRQQAAIVEGFLVLFSQFDRRSVYTFPLGRGEILPVLDAIIADARQRGIPCCLTGLSPEHCAVLEKFYPGKFRIYPSRDAFDYVYNIDNLADLKGRKYQRKRNHLHRFRALCPQCRAEALTPANLEAVRDMAADWYRRRQLSDPHGDYHLEQIALERALADPWRLGLEGLVLLEGNRVLAFSMASPLSADTYDVHFEKAREDVEGAYAAINQAFAYDLRQRHPQLRYLNREDDMGLEGLRKAKLSYCPAFLVEKYWARLWEDIDEN